MSDASEGGRDRGFDRSVGSAAALFEHATTPIVAVAGGDAPRVEVVNAAYLEVVDGDASGSQTSGQFARRRELAGTERALARSAIDGRPETDTLTRRTHDGHRQFQVRAIPADSADVDAFLVYRDVTVRRIRDQQLAVLRRVLRHDLRNDLTVVLGFAETILERTSDPEIREAAEHVLAAAGDLQTVAGSASRMECVTASPETITLAGVATRLRREVGDDLKATLSIERPLPEATLDGRVRIGLEELCRSLSTHCDAGRIDVAVERTDSWVTATLETDVTVSDQQCAALRGLEETKLRHASGLSAWLARWAVRAAGGAIRVESAPRPGGTQIQVGVPVAEDSPRLSTPPIPPADD